MPERIVSLKETTGGILDGYIVINETHRGPALGGTRVQQYNSSEEALEDAKKLALMMSRKVAIAGLPFGGGKGVINGDPKELRTPESLSQYAQVIHSLGGTFYTGEDVGLEEKDVQYMLTISPYFIGKTGLAGDPSGYAAESAFLCAQEALRLVLKKDDCNGVHFAIKGVGKTGSELLMRILKAGGVATIADTNITRALELKKRFPEVTIADSATIHSLPVDIFAPCALGGDISEETISEIQAKIICGTANNQIASPELAKQLQMNGIAHIPDYIANAGGVINVADELMPGGYTSTRVRNKINELPVILRKVWNAAENGAIDLDTAAERMVNNYSVVVH